MSKEFQEDLCEVGSNTNHFGNRASAFACITLYIAFLWEWNTKYTMVLSNNSNKGLWSYGHMALKVQLLHWSYRFRYNR